VGKHKNFENRVKPNQGAAKSTVLDLERRSEKVKEREDEKAMEGAPGLTAETDRHQ